MKQKTALVSLQEICVLLNRTPEEMIYLCEKGKCPHWHKDKLYRFPKDQVLKVIKPKPEKKEEKTVSSIGTTAKRRTRKNTEK